MKFVLLILLTTSSALAQQEVDEKNRIIYKYKKFEKFDFDDLVIEGDTGNPGDLSINPRYINKFKNKLPLKVNFNPEIVKGVERVR